MATHPVKRDGDMGIEIHTLSLAPPILSSGSLYRSRSFAHTSEDGAACPDQKLGARASSFPASVPAAVRRKALPSGIFDQEDRASGAWTLARRRALSRARASGDDGPAIEVGDSLFCSNERVVDRVVPAVTLTRKISLKGVPRFSKDAHKVAASDSWRARSTPIARCPSSGSLDGRLDGESLDGHRGIAADPGTPSKMLQAFESVEDWGRSSSSESLSSERYGAGFNALSSP